ncbi:hypothetical protein D3C87_1653450 [compost metagenome]
MATIPRSGALTTGVFLSVNQVTKQECKVLVNTSLGQIEGRLSHEGVFPQAPESHHASRHEVSWGVTRGDGVLLLQRLHRVLGDEGFSIGAAVEDVVNKPQLNFPIQHTSSGIAFT